ncbi:MAG: sigma-70 family RNA polymerase sigma factor [Labilithrix sp.]|nr:sigma-70 family RNA polymerase sigma factor [Labilithrix sp.]
MAATEHEHVIRARWESGDRRGAIDETIKRYGPEIFGLLMALHDDEDEAADAFSELCERLLRSIDGFGYRCSMRTWAYLLARRASRDVRRSKRRRRAVPLSEADELGQLVARVRTCTMTILRTETKTALGALRDELEPEDRMLLVLRVDRKLAWDELARVFLDEDASDQRAVVRESARLRKRFQLVKDRLRALAAERGLLDES